MQRKIVISINASWNILNFRQGLVEALRRRGWRVIALSPADEHCARLGEIGVEHVPLAIDGSGLSPIGDARLLLRYRQILREIRPDAFLGYTAKPNIYGSLAAQELGIPVISNISGLGTAFLGGGLLRHIVASLYRLALRRSDIVFFQNPDDLRLFLSLGLVQEAQARLLPGSGIDLVRFFPAPPRPADNEIIFLLVGRLLRQKGVIEFVEAARRVRQILPQARCQLLGFLDAPNRSAIGRAEVDTWVREGAIEYLGATDDVRGYVAAADCVVLPSYREGLPRTLLEAAAMAKPLIATDVPGCRQLVEPGVNGFLCAVGDAGSLAEAMIRMARLPPEARAQMGAASRVMAERHYGEDRVIEAYLEALDERFTAADAAVRHG